MLSVTVKELDVILCRAKSKTRNGVFQKGSFKYTGDISQFCYGFLSSVGRVDYWNVEQELKKLIKEKE